MVIDTGPVTGPHARAGLGARPARCVAGFDVRAGRPFPRGVSTVPDGVNFSVAAVGAVAVALVLHRRGDERPWGEILIPDEYRIGAVWSIVVTRLDPASFEYSYRVRTPGSGTRVRALEQTVADPYARAMVGRDVWFADDVGDTGAPRGYRGVLPVGEFDWAGDRPLGLPIEELVIYEAHVRGATRHPSSGVEHPGTFHGLTEKIPYLRALGVTCLELMPVLEFDELDVVRGSDGTPACNFWGYHTSGFFAPKAGFAAAGAHGGQIDELKELVRSLHANGIEVVLDISFGEVAAWGDGTVPGAWSPVGGGAGTAREFVVACLRWWAAEFHVDGFRLDLAAVLDRDEDVAASGNPVLVDALLHDPVLRDCKLVVGAGDGAGPVAPERGAPSRWAGWNTRFRDTVRRFVRGDPGMVGDLAARLVGSPDVYRDQGPLASVNFVTCHDGLTLRDLVSYDGKHNEANGEGNRDGPGDDMSWNCGVEGPTEDPDVLALRAAQVRNALVLLLVSQGVPMLLGGDELGRTQCGNNNAYCHDDETSWVDWGPARDDAGLQRFTTALIAQRRAHPMVRDGRHPRGTDASRFGIPDVSWHGMRAWEPDWSHDSRLLGVLRCGECLGGGTEFFYGVFNAGWSPADVELPELPPGFRWHLMIDTARSSPEDCAEPGAEIELAIQHRYHVASHSSVALIGRATTSDAEGGTP